MEKKNILFISPFFPYPLISGGHQALFNGIKALGNQANLFLFYEEPWDEDNTMFYSSFRNDLNFPIKIFRFKQPQPQKEDTNFYRKIYIKLWLLKERGLTLLKIRKEKKYVIRMDEFLPKSSLQVDEIKRIINENHIHIVQCDMLATIGYIFSLPSHVKKVFVHHELGFVREKLNVETMTQNPDEYKDALLEYKKAEINTLNLFDTVITLSTIDKEKLIRSGVNCEILASFAVVTPKKFECSTNKYHILSFVGPSYHSPNFNGIMWFLKNCWNELKMKDSSYKLQIIGKWSEEEQKRVCHKYPDVAFTGFVDDLASVLRDTIMIVPILVGSGIRMKIIESANIGVPIVSTTIGAEGIPVKSGLNCFIADTPSDFINSIIALKDDKLRNRFVLNANETIAKHFSFEAFRKSRIEIIDF